MDAAAGREGASTAQTERSNSDLRVVDATQSAVRDGRDEIAVQDGITVTDATVVSGETARDGAVAGDPATNGATINGAAINGEAEHATAEQTVAAVVQPAGRPQANARFTSR
ncbi:MAG: hypothetical protein ACRYF3_17260, partial [Janthinobacterium lividum]